MKMYKRIVRTAISSAITSGYSCMSVPTTTGSPDELNCVIEGGALW